MKHFQISLFVLSVALLSLPSFAQRGGAAHGGNGGGVKRLGRVLTFNSAKVQLHRPSNRHQIPGFQTFMDSLDHLVIDWSEKANFLKAALPSNERMYFVVDEIDQKMKDKLFQAYAEVLGTETHGLEFAAITIGTETYLLPAFFELETDHQRAAILFHEMLWVLQHQGLAQVTLASVLDLEMSYENWLDHDLAYDGSFFRALGVAIDNPYIDVLAAYRATRKVGLFRQGGRDIELFFPWGFTHDRNRLRSMYWQNMKLAERQNSGIKIWEALFHVADRLVFDCPGDTEFDENRQNGWREIKVYLDDLVIAFDEESEKNLKAPTRRRSFLVENYWKNQCYFWIQEQQKEDSTKRKVLAKSS